jgi:hypothetical protein
MVRKKRKQREQNKKETKGLSPTDVLHTRHSGMFLAGIQ